MNAKEKPAISEVRMDEVEEVLRRARTAPLSDEDCGLLRGLAESYAWLTQVLEQKATTIGRLRQMLFGVTTEKTENVLGKDAAAGATGGEGAGGEDDKGDDKGTPKEKAKGHGRNGVNKYSGAQRIRISHPTLSPGAPCPECGKGKVYLFDPPGVLLRVRGQAPLQATVYELEKLRCNLCGVLFTAPAPKGIGPETYDARAASMIALLRYGSGHPFNRLAGLQESVGVPLPASTQWDIVKRLAVQVMPAFEELVAQAAQGEVLHNDDTTMKILELMDVRSEEEPEPGESPKRRGIFTSGIVSTTEGRRIALFFTGQRHAGENLAKVLAGRARDLPPPIQMCDALDRNLPGDFAVLLANCIAHGRRRFVEVAEDFPVECRHVLETLREVYRNDAAAKNENMTPEERMRLHRTRSRPLLTRLRRRMRQEIRDKKVEPNSGLGEAYLYMNRHWKKLTLFLRVPGAPLDNNLCEAGLKRAILHRKNSLFYKTQKGAQVGDVFMSLIHTCKLSGADPLDYLTELQGHAGELVREPQAWMPWNYRQTLAAVPPP